MKRKIFTYGGLAAFLGVLFFTICFDGAALTMNPGLLFNYLDTPSFLIVAGGGAALAFVKLPKNKNEFLKYFSKTAVLSGVLATLIGVINMLANLDDPKYIFGNIAMALITIFYGLICSGISYALCRDDSDKEQAEIIKRSED